MIPTENYSMISMQDSGYHSKQKKKKNFKNTFVRDHWTDFSIIRQKCSFGDPLPRLFKPSRFATRGTGCIFPIYPCIKKILLVRNHWTDFNIVWPKCSFVHPPPWLFKPSWVVKNMAIMGAGLIVPIYLYRKLSKSVCLEQLDQFQYNLTETLILVILMKEC